ncbi:GPW/gp25 family protein [Celerinatantimonas yamalensis]|uniref:GPW/gp25 family protein n=1 Tax=Celerinatantimonas yamalensis TaxID=559956 RepID=A0ABW9G1T6_9GAMM
MSDHNNFLGRGWAFPPRFNAPKQQVALSQDEQDIQESLRILLSTTPGERIMHLEFGCDLHRLVFAELSQTTLTEIKMSIKQAILYFETRIDLLDIEITIDAMQGNLIINITYLIVTTNTRGNMVYPFYLQEGTLIAPQLLPQTNREDSE